MGEEVSTTTTTNPPAVDPIAGLSADAIVLPAASYDFQELEKGLDHAIGLKTEKGRSEALAKIVNQPVSKAAAAGIALPPGCEVKDVELDDGTVVKAAVSKPAAAA